MIQGKCPICGKRFETPDLASAPGFPFCSDRCKLVDLGRWIDGDYALPVGSAPPLADVADDDEESED